MDVYFFIYVVAFITMLWDGPRTSLVLKKRLMTFAIIWLTAFFGFRWECGTDWDQYYWIFKEVTWGNFFNMNRYGDQNVEVGFAFFNVLFKTIGFGSYTFYLLFSNALRFICMAYISFKLSKYPITTFFGFLSIQYFFPTRNPFATAVFSIAYLFVVNRDLRKYIITWLSACSIHISSVLVVPVYWLYGFRLKYIYQIAIYVGSIVLERLLVDYLRSFAVLLHFGTGTFTGKLETYSEIFREEGSRSLIQYLLPVFFLSLFEYIRRKYKFTNETEKMNFDFYVISYLTSLLVISIFQNSMVDLTRYSEFLYTWPLLIPFVLEYFRKYERLIIFIIMAYYIYRLNNSINYNEYRDMFIPYNSIFGRF